MRKLLLVALLLLPALHAARGASADDLLEPDQAFRFSARALDSRTVEVHYAIAKGYYLYRERFRFAAEPASAKLGPAEFPKGEIHQDQFFGRTETYRDELRIRLPVDFAGADHIKLRATSQGCADIGVCYIPQVQATDVRLDASGGPFSGYSGNDPLVASPAAGVSEELRFTGVLESGRLWAVVAVFFGAGILLAFTPCVLPMIPILSGIILGDRGRITRRRALLVSLAYVLGMSVTYTAIGVGAALSGNLLSAALQNAWVLGSFAAIFVFLALSMFGFYELQLPSGWHARFTEMSNRLGGGHWAAVALMGVLSAAIVSPCVAAPLAGALLYIGQTRNTLLGGVALFSMAIGMGVPLVLVGVSEGAFLPKTGRWMKSVKHFFGALLFALAIWIIAPVIPVTVQMLLWSGLLIGSGVYLHAVDRLPHDASNWTRFWKAVGILALLAGVAQGIGAFSGARDPLRPLAGVIGRSDEAPRSARFERVKTLAELDARLQSAGRPVMLDFYADWCVSCKEMERFTFSDPRVQARLAGVLLLQVDVTANTEEHKALLKRFRLFGPPGTVFFDRSGREISRVRVIGYQPPATFIRALDAAGL